jgi:hypothetical protein
LDLKKEREDGVESKTTIPGTTTYNDPQASARFLLNRTMTDLRSSGEATGGGRYFSADLPEANFLQHSSSEMVAPRSRRDAGRSGLSGSLGDSIASSTQIRFSVHTPV